MQENEFPADKRIVEQLSFGAKTAKRVTWEAWEFTIVGPGMIEVVNASYGCEKSEHSYEVRLEERDGVTIPAECGCPADEYNDEYDCKHKLAVATVGGLTLLHTAVAATPSSPPPNRLPEDEVAADGGTVASDQTADPCPNGAALCDGPEGEVYRATSASASPNRRRRCLKKWRRWLPPLTALVVSASVWIVESLTEGSWGDELWTSAHDTSGESESNLPGRTFEKTS